MLMLVSYRDNKIPFAMYSWACLGTSAWHKSVLEVRNIQSVIVRSIGSQTEFFIDHQQLVGKLVKGMYNRVNLQNQGG